MPFSQSTKERALVAAGRRCCLCGRFKGVRLEVHHIRPESSGGGNAFDNAISLCFDCHADVGHYNTTHPRGNRYSPTELRQHRDRLYAQVESGLRAAAPARQEWAYCRYLICKSFSAFGEIVRGHFDRIPVDNPVLADTVVLREMHDLLIEVHGSDTRASSVPGDSFANADEYYARHPHLKDSYDATAFSYFDASRTPDEAEIRMKVGPIDPISAHLLNAGASPEDVCVALCYEDGCIGGFTELYKTRQVWPLFLEIRNISPYLVALDELRGMVDNPRPQYRRSITPCGASWYMQLPSGPILPRQSVLAPLGVLLGPLHERLPAAIRGESSELDHAYHQDVDCVDYSSIAHGMGLLGTMIWPSSLTAERDGASLTQEIHKVDLTRLYTIDRSWAMGSCPFLFFRSQNGRIEYVRELFAEGPSIYSIETIVVPSGISGLIVAELEREVTFIQSAAINGRRLPIDLELNRGDCWELPVQCGDEVQLIGKYVPEMLGQQDPLHHNQVIGDFVSAQLSK